MKKSVLLGITVLLGLSTIYAQDVPKRVAQELNVDVQSVQAIQQSSEQVTKKSPITADGNKKLVRIKENLKSTAINANGKVTRAASDAATGTFIMYGESNFDGPFYWTITIEKDKSDATKYWISNVDNFSTEKIYGTLAGNTLTIPAGQVCINVPPIKAEFIGLSVDGSAFIEKGGNITAKIDESKHTITFVEGFGSRITAHSDPSSVGFWYEIILAGAVATSSDYFTPPTSYSAPEGILNYGLSRDFYSLNTPQSLASPFTTWKWTNQTPNLEGINFSWSYSDDNGENATSTERDLSFEALPGDYLVPSLKGSYKNQDSTYLWSASSSNYGKVPFVRSGGASLLGEGNRMFDLTNANLDYDAVSWRFAEGVYVFGTGVNSNGWASNSLLSFYEKPQSTLIFAGVDIYLGEFNAPANTKFEVYVVKAKLNEKGFPILGDTIAKGTTTTEKAMIAAPSAVCLPFDQLVQITEDEFGDKYETEIPYAEINDSFVLIFTGYNKKDVKLAVRSEYIDRPNNKNYSFFTYTDPTTKKEVLSAWASIRNTMYMQLHDAAISYISPNTSIINAESSGSTHKLTLSPYFNKLELVKETCPEWIKITQNDHFEQENWGSDLEIKVSALPQGITSRSAEIQYKSHGASSIITVNQSEITGITDAEVSLIKVDVANDNFELTYPEGVNSVSVINAAGQTLITKDLPASGKYTLPAADLSKGVYILTFSNNEVIKIAK